ncbi:MAG TPA: hypothetical protein VMJ65_24570 [Solirubrobacteraceae bacterium]|nr:hypothetical protein [Solirubrobacteraceae bacterium]
MRRMGRVGTVPGAFRFAVALLATLALGFGGMSTAPASAGTATAAAGSPDGHFYVPPAGRAVDSRGPNRVIGRGTPASCTSVAVVRAVAAGGIITFNCGPKPVTIVMNATASVIKTRHRVVLDGGGLVTLSGGGKRRILYSDTCAGTWSTDDCVDQPYPQIVVQNITFKDGYAGAHQATCTANAPACWYGGVDGGGAIYVEGGQFRAVNSSFIDNRCYSYGPDLGGGAIRALAQYHNRPVYITGDSFSGGRCSNGGALSSISVQWNILNSEFTNNKAVGWGANPASRGTAGGGSGGAVYLDGQNDNVLIAGTVMDDNGAREGGGAVFDVVDSGWGTLIFNRSHLHNDISGQFQTFPGVYYDLDGHDRPPVMIKSTSG